MSRRVARDCLQDADVRPYERDVLEEECVADDEVVTFGECRNLELELLDLVELGPYLLLVEARERADAIITEARLEAERLREQARAESVVEGYEQGKQEALPSAVAFANAGQALIVFEESMITRYAPTLAQLAVEIAEKIVYRAVTADPEIVASVLERARQEVREARHICIRLHPADHQLLAEMRPDLLRLGSESGRIIEVASDPELSRGGCRLETENGLVDATVPAQIAEVRRQLLDETDAQSSAKAVERPGGVLEAGREL